MLQDRPNLKLVLSHGGFLPRRRASIMPPRRVSDTCTCSASMPTTYLKRLYFDSIVYTHHQLEYLLQQYGADHRLLGTDYPADMGEVDPRGLSRAAWRSTTPSVGRFWGATRRGC